MLPSITDVNRRYRNDDANRESRLPRTTASTRGQCSRNSPQPARSFPTKAAALAPARDTSREFRRSVCVARQLLQPCPPTCLQPARCGRSTWTACRRATTRARPAKTSRPGSPRRRPAAIREAWEIIVRDNPMPAVHGRVCYHPCEDSCNRDEVDEAVSIHAVERFLGDMALAEGWTVAPDAPPSGKRVLVVGAGPSGLSAAWHLARRGHTVVIHEAGPMAGGMMHFGIPKYRLPREVLDAEIERIAAARRRDRPQSQGRRPHGREGGGRFDAVFLAVGAHLSKRQDIPARDAGKIYDALQFLKDVEVRPTDAADRPPGGDLRRRQHGDGRRAHGAAARRRRAAHHLPPHPRADARARLRGRRGHRGRHQDSLAAHDQADRRHDVHGRA